MLSFSQLGTTYEVCTQSLTYLITAEKGASSGTETTLQGCSSQEVRIILKVTLLPLLIDLYYHQSQDPQTLITNTPTIQQSIRIQFVPSISRDHLLLLSFLYLFLMTDPEILTQFDDDRLHQTTPGTSDKLPLIHQPASRNQQRSKAGAPKFPPTLPLIKNDSSPAYPAIHEQKEGVEPMREDFALQIEQKLKLVLQNVNKGEIEEGSEAYSQVEFEQLIQQNKEILKHHKQQQSQNKNMDSESRPSKKQLKRKSKTLKTTNLKHDNSLYEKRIKEYRDGPPQNKYLQRKKDILAHRQDAIDKQTEKQKNKVQKQDEEGTSANTKNTPPRRQVLPHNFQSNKSVPKAHGGRSSLKEKKSMKNLNKDELKSSKLISQEGKSANLFDNIHNLLLNPQKSRSSSVAKKLSNSNIKLLQQKIKSINDKLGVKDEDSASMNQQGQKTALDWKRFEYRSGGHFKCHYDSNFEKELDKIDYLQEKSNDYLSRLVSHQKTLVELSLMRKSRPPLSQNGN